MEAKKISFGFSKINKKPNLLPTRKNEKTETKIELIKCVESCEIKLVEERPEEKPLIIPIKEAQKTSAAIASLIKRRAVLLDEEEPEFNAKSVETHICTNDEESEDIEKRAARELLAETQMNGSADVVSNLVLPITKPDDLPLEGAKESSLENYEDIPVQEFGKAMLRGMGWTEPIPKANRKGGPPIDDTPMVRPKGMGLGADKAIKKKNLLVAPEANEVLEIKRNAYVLILGGKHKDLYGTIEGFDDHAGRVIVKMAIGGAKEAFNEFLCQPVSRKEYAQYGKCINTIKYDEYKKKENEHGQIILDKDNKHKKENFKIIKRERKDSEDYRYSKSDIDYAKQIKKEETKEDKKYIKRETDSHKEQRHSSNREKESNSRDVYDKYDEKNSSKKEYIESRKETKKHDSKKRKNESSGDELNAHSSTRYYERDHTRASYRDESKSDSSRLLRRNESENYNNYARNECSTSNRHRDEYRDNKREIHAEPRKKDFESSSNSESNLYAKKHKKSKKSKKSKKRYKKSTDTDSLSSSIDSSSDSEEEKYKRHKKKTKKSKRQRERSRSRGRR